MTGTDFDVAVIGAGVIGLAIGRHLAQAGASVVVLEREPRFGHGASSRNSGCIHAGVYYHSSSLKAQLCLRGRDLLYAFCDGYGVPHRRCGKLFIVTEPSLIPGLERLRKQAETNGIRDLQELDGRGVRGREPTLAAEAALYCPWSGVIDAAAYMMSLVGLGEAAGMTLVTRTGVCAAQPEATGWQLIFGAGSEDRVRVRSVVNAAGLWGLDLARTVFPGRLVPQPAPLKGAYLRYARRSPLSHLVYPDLIPGVLTPRVDATPGMDDVLRFGPNSAVAASYEDYAEPAGLIASMLPDIQRYLPQLRADDVVPDFVGVRPRIAAEPGAGPTDFRFEFADTPAWLDLWGIESPGLTASLAIAEHVHALLSERDLV